MSSGWETIATWFVGTSTRVAGDDGRAVLGGQHLAQPGDVIRQRGQRKLGCCDVVAVGLQALDDGAPTGAVGPRAVDKDDVRYRVHFSGSFLGSRGREPVECVSSTRPSSPPADALVPPVVSPVVLATPAMGSRTV